MRFSSRTVFIILVVAGIAASGFILRPDPYFLIQKNFRIFSEVYEKVSGSYIEEVDPEKLIRSGIDAMLNELDPYTVLIDETGSRQMDIVTTGQYAGVGLEVGARGGQLVVIAPIEGYSAERRGVRAGDIIKKVDDIDVTKMTTEDLQSLLRGDPGTTVVLTIHRYGIEELLEFELTRETIEVKNVTYYGMLDSDARVGYILLRRFAQNAAEEVREAILDLQGDQPLDGLVLDLRNNPGGLLDEAVKIIDKFVPPGEQVVWTEGRMSRANQQYETSEKPVYPDRPLVVLQNSGSASASEIVSGALQDLDRAVVIGERSFGKGLVQIVQPLSYNMSLKMTTSKYYIPSGRSIQSTPYLTSEEAMAMQEVPDSLRTRHSTRGGRTVFEGIGIEPDLIVPQRSHSMLEIALLQNSHYFFFANEYTAGLEELDPEFGPDDYYEVFREYLEEQGFGYTTRAERHLERFIESLDPAVMEASTDRIDATKELVALEKKQEEERYSEHIKRELYLELVSRFNGSRGRMKEQLKTDDAARKGVAVIENRERYLSILEP
ncbi:MAG: S41 family peptidase [Balneolaceae bacterium]|nr:MAG: S41 family peptidase [Balneolaceae bacterium]